MKNRQLLLLVLLLLASLASAKITYIKALWAPVDEFSPPEGALYFHVLLTRLYLSSVYPPPPFSSPSQAPGPVWWFLLFSLLSYTVLPTLADREEAVQLHSAAMEYYARRVEQAICAPT